MVLCMLAALGMRVLISFLRALAVLRGDFPNSTSKNTIREFGKAFWYCFKGFNRFKEHSDLWIPAAIGFSEFAAFPILLVLGRFEVVGGWILIKTAGAWTGWRESRTSFNRFLLANIITIILSYLWLSRYVERLPCQ